MNILVKLAKDNALAGNHEYLKTFGVVLVKLIALNLIMSAFDYFMKGQVSFSAANYIVLFSALVVLFAAWYQCYAFQTRLPAHLLRNGWKSSDIKQ